MVDDQPLGPLGEEIGRGQRTVVYHLDRRRVVKVTTDDTPDTWLRAECRHLEAVERAGAPCPQGATLVDAGGRVGLASEWIDGPDLSTVLATEPDRAGELGQLLLDIQLSLFDRPASLALPDQRDRLRAKLATAGRRLHLPVAPVIAWLPDDLPLGLCHGDLHTANVLLGPRGPVLVDWFDASRGHLAAEIARTSVVLTSELAPPAAGGALHDSYVAAALAATGLEPELLDRWRTVQLTARLAERLDLHRLDEVRSRLAEF